MKYLITGGAGFIGSNIVEALLKKGESVRILDNFSSGKTENIASFVSDIEVINGDIRDYWTCTEAVKGIDYVLNQAAIASVPRSVENPLTSNVVNIDGTLNMLEASRHAGVKKFVTASSSAVYGESEELPKHEGMIPSPLSPYAINKLTNEHYCKVYNDLYGMPTVVLRYFNIFGPRQDPNGDYAPVIPKFIELLAAGRKPIIFGDGEQSRDFIYIDNVVDVNLMAATNDSMAGETFNVACGTKYTLNDLIRILGKTMDVDPSPQYDPPRPGDILHSYASIDKLVKFGYKPSVLFEEGLSKTVDFFRKK